MRILKTSLFLLSILLFACKSQHVDNKTESNPELLFPKGNKITNNNFTGNVWLHPLIENDSINQNGVGSVTFEPGARTKWHLHPSGQILLAISGTGYYQEKGSPLRILQKGDAVKCPPNLPHWHGAAPHDHFVQVAITGREGGPVVWLDPVTDAEYNQESR